MQAKWQPEMAHVAADCLAGVAKFGAGCNLLALERCACGGIRDGACSAARQPPCIIGSPPRHAPRYTHSDVATARDMPFSTIAATLEALVLQGKEHASALASAAAGSPAAASAVEALTRCGAAILKMHNLLALHNGDGYMESCCRWRAAPAAGARVQGHAPHVARRLRCSWKGGGWAQPPRVAMLVNIWGLPSNACGPPPRPTAPSAGATTTAPCATAPCQPATGSVSCAARKCAWSRRSCFSPTVSCAARAAQR